MYQGLTLNLDGSYTFIKNGFPYNCPNSDEWVEEFAEVDAYAKEHPDDVTIINRSPIEISLEELKTEKLEEISSSFNHMIKGHITTTQGYNMQFTPEDSIKMQGAITILEETGATTGYLTQYNDITIRNVPLDIMKDVMKQMMMAYLRCHDKKQTLRELVNNASSKEELDNITIDWPI